MKHRTSQRGMTMIEMMVALAVMGMVAVLTYGVMDSLSRGKKAEEMRSERAHTGREAMGRIVRDLSSAYLSMHVPGNIVLVTQNTAFVGKSSSPYDRIDFTAFAHKRTARDAKESDQCEVGYFVVPDPNVIRRLQRSCTFGNPGCACRLNLKLFPADGFAVKKYVELALVGDK